mgnify:CR=1 FL=1
MFEEIKKELGNKFFSVEFIKKDGTLRKMVCRLGVKKGVTGKGMTYAPNDRQLLNVYDVQKKAFRMINLNTLKAIKYRGKVLEIKD